MPDVRRRGRSRMHGLDGHIKTWTGLRVNQNDRGQRKMEKVHPRCGQPSDPGRLKSRTERLTGSSAKRSLSGCPFFIQRTDGRGLPAALHVSCRSLPACSTTWSTAGSLFTQRSPPTLTEKAPFGQKDFNFSMSPGASIVGGEE